MKHVQLFEQFLNEGLEPGDILTHKYNKDIKIELIATTNRGWKVKQTEPKNSRSTKTTTQYYDKQDISGDKAIFEQFIGEAKRSTVHKAAKKGSFPAVVVVVQNGKVIHQEPVSTPELTPAVFNTMQKKYPKATLHLEDNTGQRLFSESAITEVVKTKSLKKYKELKAKGIDVELVTKADLNK